MTDVENDAIDQLTSDGDFRFSVLLWSTATTKKAASTGLRLLGLLRERRARRRRCAYKWRRCRYDCCSSELLQEMKYVSQRDVGCLSEGDAAGGRVTVEGARRWLPQSGGASSAAIEDGVSTRLAARAARRRDEQTPAAALCRGQCFAQKGILRLAVKKAAASACGIAADFAVPFCMRKRAAGPRAGASLQAGHKPRSATARTRRGREFGCAGAATATTRRI